ncbi:dipeptide ABC transporter ATP-binding protein [Agromyces cerinus]|uniref:Peptide/nickel transport system ATP-binding protein n=1 Tax=Agromyces cerinus subsp. cerinus TaxID=232089 RepID=A0A1N6I7H2_9MICO|nr:ABC transporter ATP-binding protein [Agromyces cerinus]SIO27967.1 peptide/nickel transport system ATP-binding protein [Agromyces cerinus subsp. cerinus]
MTLLDISELTLDLPNGKRLLDGISLTVAEGETVGLVGESGSGKSLTARSVLGLLPSRATMGGSVQLLDQSVLDASRSELLALRRTRASMIFQDPRAGINPMRTVGDHLTETMRLCEGRSAADAKAVAISLMEAVRLPRPEEHMNQYPHELSGGMLQRVMIAGALTSSPRLLICDEPTTALDVTTQAEIIGVLAEQRASRGMGMLFITHDLNLAASICDRVYVMSAGRVEEQGDARQVFSNPQAAYTKRLVAATPTIVVARDSAATADQGADASATTSDAVPSTADAAASASASATPAPVEAMLSASGISKTYVRRGKEPVRAVIDASIEIPRGGALGVVGESGSGKSTFARMIVGLEQADTGDIRIAGRERTSVPSSRVERLEHARSVQMVFQDPYLSLDPRITAGKAIEDAMRLHRNLSTTDARARVIELLEQVGLGDVHAQARPRTLSGGQRQRVAIARALAIEPDVLVMDEATSALDVSVQAQVLSLVEEIRRERGLTVLFISHDLAVVRRLCDETVVMKTGEIVERGRTIELLGNPQHPYTRLLIDSVPRPEWNLEAVAAEASELEDPVAQN